MIKLLIADDEPNLRAMLTLFFEKRGFTVEGAGSGIGVMEYLEHSACDLIISDVRMPGMDGLTLLKTLKEREGAPPVILITAFGSDESAMEAIRSGAADYIKKPFDMEELLFRVQRVLDQTDLERKIYTLEEEISTLYAYGAMVGKSPVIRRIIAMIKQVSPLTTTVLLSGESGTGKEVIARTIHSTGPRRKKRFVSVNCGALPEPLLESELFGYEKGAFTGADRDREGLFREAHGGTIFLDEIGEMSLSMQVKLLHVLQDKHVRPVGSRKEFEVDVRIISATNKKLEEEVAAKRFREDLFYRINVVHLVVPPLRERREDIPLLAQHFITKICGEHDIPPRVFGTDTMRILERYPWPGNVRELENVIERTVALERGRVITPASLPDAFRKRYGTSSFTFTLPEEGIDYHALLNEITHEILHQALERSDGNRTRAAALLKITPRSFRYLLKKHDVSPDR